MSSLAATLQSFFTDRLVRQRQASPRTVAAYRDTFRLLLGFVQARTGRAPYALGLEHLDASVIVSFLDHLEVERHNTPRTRNARLAAVRSLFRYAALRHPEQAALIQRVLAIPQKRFDRSPVSFLSSPEIDALVAAPDRTGWEGRRDRVLLVVAVQTGLRVSELVGLNCADVVLGTGAHVRCHGKGRKERLTPLTTSTAKAVGVWLAERAGRPDDPLFPTRTGRRLSRDAVQRRITKHTAVAELQCSSLQPKRLTPHVLRHTAAMQLLHAGVDTTVIAMWLGHEDVRSTQIYLHADLAIKERALARTAPASVSPGRYRAPDPLLAFLASL
jgi:site-specific recombinase XerD